MKFFSLFDQTKNRDFLTKGPLYIWIGFGFAMLQLILIPIVGINWGIDFAGGTEMQVKFKAAVQAEQIRKVLGEQGFERNQVQSYGAPGDNEWLLRVERVTVITPEQVGKLDSLLDAELGSDVRVEFQANQGDRFLAWVKDPNVQGDAVGEQAALDAISARIGSVVEQKSDGLRLRRTRAADNLPETTDDAILRDEPYRGEVRFTVQLQGVSDKLTKALASLGELEVRRVDFVDATVAESLKTEGIIALVVSLLAILIYVAIRFDVFFGPGAVIALMHDPVGALVVYTVGRLEFDLPSIAGLLTVVGYSISHTIVIYDRVRETTPPGAVTNAQMRDIVNRAVNDTLNRTVNTTMTVLFTTVAVWIFAGGAVRAFAASMTIGCIIGAYSSLLMAPTIYLWFRERFFDPNAVKDSGPTREERERGIV